MTKRSVFFLSDHTGLTAESVGRSLLAQFKELEYEVVQWPFIDSMDKMRNVVRHINKLANENAPRPLVFSTFVDPAIRQCLKESQALVFDTFDAFTGLLESELGIESSYQYGLVHGMGNSSAYQERIHAVNFALNNDDGAITRNYPSASLILIGVSRSGKTPTCLYMGMQYGILAANYPLTDDDLERHSLPAALTPYKDRLFGLTIDVHQLQRIRKERRPNGRYSSLEQCRYEINQAEALFKRHNIPVIDTTSMSVEEIAARIMARTGNDSVAVN